jgi:small-conductance mechanosensitive channel
VKTILPTFLLLSMLLAACVADSAEPTLSPTLTPRPTVTQITSPTSTPDPAGSATPEPATGRFGQPVQAVEEISQLVASRTPVPTALPDRVERGIQELVNRTGLRGQSYLGLSSGDWINTLASIVGFVLSYLLVNLVLFRLLRWATRRTKTRFDDEFLAAIGPELQWLVLIFAGRVAALRLDFWNAAQILLLDDVFFFLSLSVIVVIALRLVRFGGDWIIANRIPETRRAEVAPLALLLKRLGYMLVFLVAASIILNRIGINVTLIVAFLLFSAAIIFLGAREAIDDTASGFLTLLDPQYRVGDDIYNEELETWARVIEVSLRNTHIQTPDNRYIIVPNTRIGKSQIVNYSLPDPAIRISTDIIIAYGTDIAEMRRVITETIRAVEGVLLDKPIHAYYLAFSDAGRRVRMMWWIEDVNQTYDMLDGANSALEEGLRTAGIEIVYPTYNLNLNWESERDLPR